MINELRIKRILFATDFPQSSGLSLDYAMAFARHFQATIVMVHVLKLPDAGIQSEMVTMRPAMTRLAAREQLEALASCVRRTGISVETYVEDGFQCDVILGAVTARAADMMVLGVHGVHLGIGHYFVGSDTEKILLSAPCPILTVGSQAIAGFDPILHPKEILYFSDFTPEAEAAAPYALLLGKEFQVPVDVCQLLPKRAEADPGLCQKLSDEYRERMRRMIPEPHSDGCLPAFHLSRGMVIEEIVKRAERQLAGLIVLGVRKRPHFGLRVHTRVA